MFDKVIGIDPGISGGLAIWSERIELVTCRMPLKQIHKNGKKQNNTNLHALRSHLEYHKEDCQPIVFIERVQGWLSDQDQNPGKVFRIQKMLKNYAELISIITLCEIPYIEVAPISWQKHLALHVKGMEKPERKKMYLNAAQQWYPKIKATLWNSDAICLVHYGRMKLEFDPKSISDVLKEPDQRQIF